MKNNDTQTVITKNLKAFIEHTGRSHAWFIKKTAIPQDAFDRLLQGEGDIHTHIPKILSLFGIDDPLYFHQTDFKLPERKQRNLDLRQLATLHQADVPGEEKEFEKTLKMLNDFINMIEILKKNTPEQPSRQRFK